MRNLILMAMMIIVSGVMAQNNLSPGTRADDAYRSVKDGYTTELGWAINEGDTLQLGIGSIGMEVFANIYSSPASFTQIMGNGNEPIKYLSNDYNNMVAVVKKFGVKGKKKTGYLAYAVVGIGEMENYWVEIENAVANGEIIPPDIDHRPKSQPLEVNVVNGGSDKYDQLAKLKALYDEGVLTKEEYEAEKKKILEQD